MATPKYKSGIGTAVQGTPNGKMHTLGPPKPIKGRNTRAGSPHRESPVNPRLRSTQGRKVGRSMTQTSKGY